MKYIQPNWEAPTQIKAYTTLRTGWHGRYTQEMNSPPLRNLLNLPNEPIWLSQIHSNFVVSAKPENRDKKADASISNEKNQVCIILTADCLPILVCNKKGTHVAAIHAGWRGLASGVIEATLEALAQPCDEVIVWLGPAIGPEKFEVGRDVFDAFVKENKEAESAFASLNKPDKWLANLYTLAHIRLKNLGISAIFGGDYCTYTEEELFFSYRRDKGNTGRIASVIWISDQA